MQASCHLCLFSCTLEWTTLELGGGSPSLQDNIPYHVFKQDPEQTKVCCPGCDLFALFPSLRILNFTISRTLQQCCSPDIHIPNQVQQSTSPHQLLSHLCQEVNTNALQKSPGLLVPCCAAPLAGTGVVQVPPKNQGLQI